LAELQKSAAEALERLDNEQRATEGRLRAAETVVAERQTAVPLQYRDIQQLKRAQLVATNQHKQLKNAFEQAQKDAEQANQAVAQSETARSAAQSSLANLSARLVLESESLLQRIATAGFATLADFQQAKRNSDRLTELEQQTSVFDKQLAAARERRNRAQGAVEQLNPPNMADLQSGIKSAKASYETALAEYTNLTGRVKQAEQWLHRLRELQQALSQLEARYAVFGRLSEVANGKNEFGLTFQRFVLGALLDDVAIAANERLKTMSRSRYHLQRTMDRARRNSAGGLELEVFDNYTGAARPVTTLSGGETFLASLSLALGLADVVQSYAGGIHLDAIFVDEGFGTLDPETLEFALQALIALQQGGRLVGIISHVPELKDRIDARLEIAVSAKGSTAVFKVS
jgi:exonuclease SbcC